MDNYVDIVNTGKRINYLIKGGIYDVIDIQNFLGLRCPQSVYRWCHGKALPTIGHLYMLSLLYEVNMEDIIVFKDGYINNKITDFKQMYLSKL